MTVIIGESFEKYRCLLKMILTGTFQNHRDLFREYIACEEFDNENMFLMKMSFSFCFFDQPWNRER